MIPHKLKLDRKYWAYVLDFIVGLRSVRIPIAAAATFILSLNSACENIYGNSYIHNKQLKKLDMDKQCNTKKQIFWTVSEVQCKYVSIFS